MLALPHLCPGPRRSPLYAARRRAPKCDCPARLAYGSAVPAICHGNNDSDLWAYRSPCSYHENSPGRRLGRCEKDEQEQEQWRAGQRSGVPRCGGCAREQRREPATPWKRAERLRQIEDVAARQEPAQAEHVSPTGVIRRRWSTTMRRAHGKVPPKRHMPTVRKPNNRSGNVGGAGASGILSGY